MCITHSHLAKLLWKQCRDHHYKALLIICVLAMFLSAFSFTYEPIIKICVIFFFCDLLTINFCLKLILGKQNYIGMGLLRLLVLVMPSVVLFLNNDVASLQPPFINWLFHISCSTLISLYAATSILLFSLIYSSLSFSTPFLPLRMVLHSIFG